MKLALMSGIALIVVGYLVILWFRRDKWSDAEVTTPRQDLACEGLKGNRCVAEGCYGEACRTVSDWSPDHSADIDTAVAIAAHTNAACDRIAPVVPLPVLASNVIPMQRTGVER